MRKKYSKLLGICLLTGLGLQTVHSSQAYAEHKSSNRKVIKHSKKKAVSYRIRRHKIKPTNLNSYQVDADNESTESGIASWYGGRHNHRRTSSRQPFDSKKLTAAHPSLPLGTKVLVTSENTGDSVVVTINDRGPFTGNRIIDLSKAAAAKIGMVRSGTAHVTVQPLTKTEVAVAPDDSLSEQ